MTLTTIDKNQLLFALTRHSSGLATRLVEWLKYDDGPSEYNSATQSGVTLLGSLSLKYAIAEQSGVGVEGQDQVLGALAALGQSIVRGVVIEAGATSYTILLNHAGDHVVGITRVAMADDE